MSETSSLIKSWFLESLTARAAYAYFTGLPGGEPIQRELGQREFDITNVVNALTSTVPGQQARFSAALANYFVAHYATLDHQANTSSGYSGTLFGHRLGIAKSGCDDYGAFIGRRTRRSLHAGM